METLLIHQDHLHTPAFERIVNALRAAGVKVNPGPRLAATLPFEVPAANSMKEEYSSLECAVEVYIIPGSRYVKVNTGNGTKYWSRRCSE